MTLPGVVQADVDQTDRVAALIALAFHELPATRWLVPDDAERPRRLKGDFRIFVEYAFEHGHVEVTEDGAGAAIWVHHNGSELPPPPDYDERLIFIAGPHLRRFRILDELFDAHHPHNVVHHHLAFLAVHPDHQNRGIGSHLMSQHHQRLDSTSTGAYLEASTPEARALYLRHGYTDRSAPFYLPDGPPFWPMWRDPQG
jgi:ribosomal protein S18 acetylase RimI-like enzyme